MKQIACNRFLSTNNTFPNPISSFPHLQMKKQQEQAEKDAQKLAKNFKKVQKKAERHAKENEKDRENAKKKMEIKEEEAAATTDRRASMAAPAQHMHFSDMVGVSAAPTPAHSLMGTTKSKKLMGTVFRKANNQMKKRTIADDTFKVP